MGGQAEPAPVAPVPQAGADIILPPEVLAQRAAEEQQRREMEKQAEQTAREVPGRRVKPASRRTVKEVIGDVIRGLERDRRVRRKRRYRMILSSGAEEAIQQVAQNVCSVSCLQAVE
ncbi:hypothetical protein [Klebsiella pneumoniae]|uniref:hypothetical protein n=1 Tax=Klebsiella pneumoniae TaxID=573 RepID=UPI00388E28D8